MAISNPYQPGLYLHKDPLSPGLYSSWLDHTPSLKDSLSNPPQCLFLYYFLFSRKSFHLCLSKCNLSPRHLKYFIS